MKEFLARHFKGDAIIWVVFVALIVVSTLEMFSASSMLVYDRRFHGTAFKPILSHMIFLGGGFFIAYLIVALIIPQPTPEYEQMFNNTSRRIYKSNDKKIAGVCGGIAEYLNADPTIIRLVFALLVVGWGTGILAYIIAALVLPEADKA